MSQFDDYKPGQTLYYQNSKGDVFVERVLRVTKTVIVTRSHRWSKKTGYEVGVGREAFYGRKKLLCPSVEIAERYWESRKQREHEASIRKLIAHLRTAPSDEKMIEVLRQPIQDMLRILDGK